METDFFFTSVHPIDTIICVPLYYYLYTLKLFVHPLGLKYPRLRTPALEQFNWKCVTQILFIIFKKYQVADFRDLEAARKSDIDEGDLPTLMTDLNRYYNKIKTTGKGAFSNYVTQFWMTPKGAFIKYAFPSPSLRKGCFTHILQVTKLPLVFWHGLQTVVMPLSV